MAKKEKRPVDEVRMIKISNEFSIRNAGEITRTMLKKLRNSKSAVIQLDHIDLFDLSAIQIIHAIRKYADVQGIKLKVEMQLSDDIKTLLGNTGFSNFV